jgi:hypothetical protein
VGGQIESVKTVYSFSKNPKKEDFRVADFELRALQEERK